MKLLLVPGLLLSLLFPCLAQPFTVNKVVNGVWILQAENSIISPASGVPSIVPADKSGTTLNQVVFKAEEEIILKPGFSATSYEAGNTSTFHAYLVPPLMYAELKDMADGSFCTTIDNMLCFRYVEKYVPGTLDYKIYNHQNKVVVSGSDAAFRKEKFKGSNFIRIDLNPSLNIPGMVATNEVNSFYVLEVKNDKGDRYVLRFKYLPL